MKVLIAVEDKVYGDAIVDFVVKHNWEDGTQFKVIHAIQIETTGYLATNIYCCDVACNLMEENQKRSRELVKEVAAAIQTKLNGVQVSEQITVGRPKDVILDTALEWKADVIVLGSHGRKGFSRFLLGSVSLSVLSHAPCSVVIVKLPDETKQQPQQQHDTSDTKTEKVKAPAV